VPIRQKKASRNGGSRGLKAGQSRVGQTTHGLRALQTILRQRKIDGRFTLAKLLKARREEYVAHYGGADHLPVPKSAVLDRVLFKTVLLESMECWALTQPELIGEGGVLPAIVLKDYITWSESLRRDLLVLGLERVAREIDPGEAVLAKVAAGKAKHVDGNAHDSEPGSADA